MSSTTVTPVVTYPASSVTLNSTPFTSGVPSVAQALDVGSNTLNLVVTAEDGVTTRIYSLSINRLTPIQSWKLTEMGNPEAPDDGDPDFDGIVNLLEYASGTDLETSAPSNVAQDTLTVSMQKYLRLTVTKNPAASDVTYEVQATSNR